jgi:predicted TIM-barrel fold metal-dependent hydrolase
MESSFPNGEEHYIPGAIQAMDEAGLALIAFDGYQAPRDGKTQGYRWGYAVHRLVNAHPDRFILATNGGTNPNWTNQKSGQPTDFIDQLEKHVRGGDYPLIGEVEFRHYMSAFQCRTGRTNRDVDIPMNGPNGHRLFRLASETGVPFGVHHEPEDAPLRALEEMLAAYPKAKVIVAHFGQLRHPEKQAKFGPGLVRRLLRAYPNLHYDISTGQPGRRYACNANVLDTVLWGEGPFWGQGEALRPEYKAILAEFSKRFVAATDYGGGRPALPGFLRDRTANLRLILRDLPEEAKHDIAYRNAWRLLTGKEWK